MDVLIKVSLQGGHSFEFVCDEDHPMVFGLVSALPGASLDSALPPDGLIQIESRSGERMFLTRSSLVAVTIGKRGTITSDAISGAPQTLVDAMMLSPFRLLPELFDASSVATLLGSMATTQQVLSAADTSMELELDVLPDTVAQQLAVAVNQLPAAMAIAEGQETHLDLHLYRLRGGTLDPATPDYRDVLGFLLYLDEANGMQPVGIAAVETDAGGVLPLAANCALVFVPKEAPRLTVQAGQLLVLRGSLRTGSVDGPA